MAGHFELFRDDRSQIRFQLLAPNGAVLAISGPFADTRAAAAAIAAVRECAGTGLIDDRSAARPARSPGTAASSMEHRRIGSTAPVLESRSDISPSLAGVEEVTVESATVEEVLQNLSDQAVEAFSRTREDVSCGFTISRPKKALVFGGSGVLARVFHDLQDGAGEGPGVGASIESGMVHVRDLGRDRRWPRLAHSAADHGIRSVLVVPVPGVPDTRILLTVCAGRPDAFDYNCILAAEAFAGAASTALRPALRIAELKDNLRNLHAALEHRTVIDTAIGVVMAQNRCGHDAAFDILVRAASTRNVKLRDVAAGVLATVSGEDLPVHFDV